jgi:hypothetical protein
MYLLNHDRHVSVQIIYSQQFKSNNQIKKRISLLQHGKKNEMFSWI